MTMDHETIQILLDLLNPLHGSLDNQMFPIRKNEELEIPRDAEYAVTVSEGQERDLTQAVSILEDRKRQAIAALPQCEPK